MGSWSRREDTSGLLRNSGVKDPAPGRGKRCRKIILISKVAIAAGAILILAIIIGAVGFDPTVLIGTIAAVIGGTVVFSSNTSTLKQTMTDMKAAEAHRTELISRMDLKVVGDGKVEN